MLLQDIYVQRGGEGNFANYFGPDAPASADAASHYAMSAARKVRKADRRPTEGARQKGADHYYLFYYLYSRLGYSVNDEISRMFNELFLRHPVHSQKVQIDNKIRLLQCDPMFLKDQHSSLASSENEIFDKFFCVRIIGLRDKDYNRRLQWLANWLDTDDVHPFDEHNTRLISQIDRPFTALAIHGNDPARMSKIVRSWRDVFSSKSIIVILSNSEPKGRAELYRAGADAVLDLKMSRILAIAIVKRVIARTRLLYKVRENLKNVPASIKANSNLNKSEVIIINALYERQGRVVMYSQFLRYLRKPVSKANIRCLQVQIQRLKSKIIDGITISNRHGEGYKADFI